MKVRRCPQCNEILNITGNPLREWTCEHCNFKVTDYTLLPFEEIYDYINPEHYKKYPKEVCDIMIETFGKDDFITFCKLSAFKYRLRLGNKPNNPIEQEIEKIKWYENKIKEINEKF